MVMGCQQGGLREGTGVTQPPTKSLCIPQPLITTPDPPTVAELGVHLTMVQGADPAALCLPTHYCQDSCRAGRALLGSASPRPLSLFFLNRSICAHLLLYVLFPFRFELVFHLAHHVMQPWLTACHGMI